MIAVFTPFNPIKLYRPLGQSEGASSGEPFSPLQDTKVLNYGQIIGLVVAESFEQARDASFLVKTRYAPQDPIASWDAGLPNAFTPKDVAGEKADIEFLANNVSSIDDAIQASPVVIDATYTELILHHNPMEPHAVTATWDGDRLTIYDATQGVIADHRNIAAVLGIDDALVRVICPYVGGGFGCKGSMWLFTPLIGLSESVWQPRSIRHTATRHR